MNTLSKSDQIPSLIHYARKQAPGGTHQWKERDFALNPLRRLIWAWFKFLLTSRRDHVRKHTNVFFYIPSHTTLNKTFMSYNIWRFSQIILIKTKIRNLDRWALTTSIPIPFICKSPPPPPPQGPSINDFFSWDSPCQGNLYVLPKTHEI